MYLLRLVTRHLKRTRMSESDFGRAVLNDPRLVQDLRRGREPRPRTAAKICTYIADARGARR